MTTATELMPYAIHFFLNGSHVKSHDLKPGPAGSLKAQARLIAKLDHGTLPLDWVLYGIDSRDQIDFGHYVPKS